MKYLFIVLDQIIIENSDDVHVEHDEVNEVSEVLSGRTSENPRKRSKKDSSAQSDDSFIMNESFSVGGNVGDVMRQILSEMKEMRSELSGMREEWRGEITSMKEELRKEVGDLVKKELSDMNEKFEAMVVEVKKEVQREVKKEVEGLGRRVDMLMNMVEISDVGVAKIKDDVREQARDMNKVKGELDSKMRDLNSKLNECVGREKELVWKSIDIEARSRRSNLIFHGIKEQDNENCVKVVEDFIKTDMGISEPVIIQRAHRLGRPLPKNSVGRKASQPRPMIVNMLDYRQREAVRAARTCLKHPLGVSEDLPFEIRKARESLLPELKELRRQNKRCSIVWPARLLCEGEIVAEKDVTKFCKK